MAVTAAFGFDENADLESNLTKFNTHLGLRDAALSAQLTTFYPVLRDETYTSSTCWFPRETEPVRRIISIEN